MLIYLTVYVVFVIFYYVIPTGLKKGDLFCYNHDMPTALSLHAYGTIISCLRYLF